MHLEKFRIPLTKTPCNTGGNSFFQSSHKIQPFNNAERQRSGNKRHLLQKELRLSPATYSLYPARRTYSQLFWSVFSGKKKKGILLLLALPPDGKVIPHSAEQVNISHLFWYKGKSINLNQQPALMWQTLYERWSIKTHFPLHHLSSLQQNL